MSLLSCPGPDLLLLHHHGLLDEPEDAAERTRLEAHLTECEGCQGWSGQVLAAPALPFDPADAFPALQARIDAWEAEAAPAEALDLNVRLLCTYCKDGLSTALALYCAECLAPHHDDCFAEHGRCSAPGCEGLDVVRTTEPPKRARGGTSRWRRAGLIVLGVALGGGAAAAWAPGSEPAPSSPPPGPSPQRDVPAPAEEPYRVEVYDIGDLLEVVQGSAAEPAEPAWIGEFRQVLVSRIVTINLMETPIDEVVAFLQDITGLNIVLSQEVGEDITVSVRLRQIVLDDALAIILEQCGLAATLANESYVIHSGQGRWSYEPSQPAARPVPLVLNADRVLKQVRDAVALELGAEAWEVPASVTLEGTSLVVNQRSGGQALVQRELNAIRGEDPLPPLGETWFSLLGEAPDPPALGRALALERLLGDRTLTLNMEGTELQEVLEFLHDASGVEARLDPGIAALATKPVNLRLHDVKLESALELICMAVDPQLVWDIDRRGVLIRSSGALAYETRLARAAERVLGQDESRDAVRQRLETQRLSLDFDEAPLRQALDFFRNLTGLNFVVSARARAKEEGQITIHVEATTLQQALDACLRQLDLGYRIGSGVIRIVPRGESDERMDLHERLEALGREPLAAGETLGVSVGALAARLERSFSGEVVLGPRAQRSRERLAVPVGATVKQALELAEQQLALRHGWTWVDGRPVMALRKHESGTLIESAYAARVAAEWSGSVPQAVIQAEAETRSELRGALERLAALGELEEGSLGVETLSRLLEPLQTARAQLDDVRFGGRILASPEPSESRHVVDPTPLVIARILQADAALAQRMRLAQVEREQGEAALRVIELAFQDTRVDYAERRAALEARLVGLGQDDPVRIALEDRIVMLERRLAEERSARLAPGLDELETAERDRQLDQARALSEIGMLEARLQELTGYAPGWDAIRARLDEGQSWDAVFPVGFATRWERDLALGQELVARGLKAARRLGLVLRPDLRVVQVSRGRFGARAGVPAGSRVVSFAGQPIESLWDFVEQLGRAEGLRGPLRLSTLEGGRLDLTLWEAPKAELTEAERAAPDPSWEE